MTTPVFAIRGNGGISVLHVQDEKTKSLLLVRNESATQFCRVMKFSDDGDYFAYCDGLRTVVLKCEDQSEVISLELPRTVSMFFSPKNSILCAFEPYAIRKGQTETPLNLKLYDLKTGNLVAEYAQKKQTEWWPQWTDDESLVSHTSGSEILFHEHNRFDEAGKKLTVKGFGNYAVSKGAAPCHIGVYVPGTKGSPCFVKLFKYPKGDSSDFGAVVANKSFFKCDRCELKWCNSGNAMLGVAAADVDKSGTSYYGETTLFLLLTNGDGFRITLAKDGPVYSYQFNPVSDELCVVYGLMPAKATLFNFKGEPTFDFGTGPRNEVHYSPFGNLLILAGFGNLRGGVQVWTTRNMKKISEFVAEDTTYFQWAPNGEHVICATTTPRLRVNNGFRIFHYTGTEVNKTVFPQGSELWEFLWQPVPTGYYSQQPLKFQSKPAGGAAAAVSAPSGGYVPPHLRGSTNAPKKLNIREEELPQNAQSTGDTANMSKNAMKNKKKREARKATVASSGNDADPAGHGDAALAQLTGNPETDKKIKNINRKLQQIEGLKQQLNEGKTLEANQLEKLKKENELIAELEALEV